MIATTQKPLEEIQELLKDRERIVIIGCGGCSALFRTGGPTEVRKMARTLEDSGKQVLAAIAPPLNTFTCNLPQAKKQIEPYRDQLAEAEAILMLACGDGLQVVREGILEDEFGLVKPIYPGVDTIGLMGGGPDAFKEKCLLCGQCELGAFAGICPLTQCTKGLMNGPCGGSHDGKCEVEPERECGWILIYERLRDLGELDQLRQARRPKDWSKANRPRTIQLSTTGNKQTQ